MKVVELFAGVGGFRLAANRANKKFNFVWANQWEPNKKNQFAFDCYQKNFGISKNHLNEDITIAKHKIPKNFDLLVGGFPCQDYSVATTKAKGIEGIKGVLWWEINWILEHRKPRLVLLENVDRLLKSPANQKGRDFAIMLRCFHDNGYNVEWMMNNGADFGFVQRRKRVFIYAYRRDCKKSTKNLFEKTFEFKKNGHFLKFNINDYKNLLHITKEYDNGKFYDFGKMINGEIQSYSYIVEYKGENKFLKDIVIAKSVDKKYYLNDEQLSKMKYLRSSKRILRKKTNGDIYYYTEGRMNLDDDINKKSRTMLTSEGTINRSSHLIKENKKYRFITPLEAERLNGFDDNWTEGMLDRHRYFCMGNALNVDLVKKIFEKIR